MKKLLVLFSFFLLQSSLVLGQPLTCNDGSFEITSAVCSGNVLTFVVENTSPTGCSAVIVVASPNDVTISGDAFIGNVNQLFFFGDATISLPSPNCQPMTFTLSYSGINCTDCAPRDFDITPQISVPTMDEWSIIVLFLMLSISGVLIYKSKFVTIKNRMPRANL